MANRVTAGGDIVDQIVALLSASGIHQIPRKHYASWPPEAMAFEDEYSLVAVWQYDTFDELKDSWLLAQDHVIRLLGSTLVNNDPKSWDGYLVLVTADPVPSGEAALLSAIRTDTRRLRKLVITGDDVPAQIWGTLEVAPAVRRALAPVIDLTLPESLHQKDPLESIVERTGLTSQNAAMLDVLLRAYRHGQPLVETLYDSCLPDSNEDRTNQ